MRVIRLSISDELPRFLYDAALYKGDSIRLHPTVVSMLGNARDLRFEDMFGTFESAYVSPWLQLPTLTTFSAVRFTIREIYMIQDFALTALHLQWCRIHPETFVMLLQSCKCLTTLTHRTGDYADGRSMSDDIGWIESEDVIGPILEHVPALRKLYLYYTVNDIVNTYSRYTPFPGTKSWNSLSKLSQLSLLDIDARLVFGADKIPDSTQWSLAELTRMLPPPVSTLKLCYFGFRLQEEYRSFLKIPGLYPQLRCICIYNVTEYFYTAALLEDMRRKFRAVGVKFKYCLCHHRNQKEHIAEYDSDAVYPRDFPLHKTGYDGGEGTIKSID
ncbi:uncharacterized protein BDZ99DRAFT_482515 [Mytilinidion resinicola]|uniref:F-box domain-containing protein n=1 Tax=Mytilinidion resinicola TaxID=574789 RepID=A0A6A6Y2G0_9PEZI|nr:uncharacterized protein BDZ99DRAFT_482515 [Mytilinidion resinicola]KAF2802972.1 hypothetical protein BDZ99DRAFT_482515 [Mytilinidion resinicola]